MGAMALFGEKYSDVVRVVSVGDYSIELCGGCHVQNTAEVGLFKIVTETGIGAGTRRIEARTGQGAYQYYEQRERLLDEAAKLLKTKTEQIPSRIESLYDELKSLEREKESLTAKIANYESANITEKN